MDFFSATILGMIEGVTEFLPVSSTAHLLITEKLLGISGSFALTFAIFVQGASVLAIIALYFKKVLSNLSLIPKIIVGFLPTAIVGALFYDFIKGYLLESMAIIASSLFFGGVLMILIDKKNNPEGIEIEKISYKDSFVLGLSQVFALIPGMSRSGSTIIGGRLAGLPRRLIIEFSFLLAIPTILGATVFDISKNAYTMTQSEVNILLVGAIVSFVVSLLVAKWLLAYLSKNSFSIFGWYRILLAVFIIIFFVI